MATRERGIVACSRESERPRRPARPPRPGLRRPRRQPRRRGGHAGRRRSTPSRPCPAPALVGVSRLYATTPVGVTDQPEFRNAVVALDVPAGPDPETGALALLLALKAIERAFGRQARERWGPRELDLDLLVFGRHAIHVERPPAARSDDPAKPAVQWLQVPHASARERLFVLAPLADLAPGLRPARLGRDRRDGRAPARRRARARTPLARSRLGRRSPATWQLAAAVDAIARMRRATVRRQASGADRPPLQPDRRRPARSNMWTVSTKRTCFVW